MREERTFPDHERIVPSWLRWACFTEMSFRVPEFMQERSRAFDSPIAMVRAWDQDTVFRWCQLAAIMGKNVRAWKQSSLVLLCAC